MQTQIPFSVPSEFDIKSIFEAYLSAWNARDPDKIAAMHSYDTKFWFHSGEDPVIGKAAVRDRFAEVFRQYPEYQTEVVRTFFGEKHWVMDWFMVFDHILSDGTKHQMRWDAVDIITVNDHGHVTRKDTYHDYTQVIAMQKGNFP